MNRNAFTIYAAVGLGLVFSSAPIAQEPAEENTPESPAQSAEHDAIRDAHRAAMQQQMQQIQQIEDPEERQRRMEELHTAMDAMRDAMRSTHHPECVAGDSCGHGNRGGMGGGQGDRP